MSMPRLQISQKTRNSLEDCRGLRSAVPPDMNARDWRDLSDSIEGLLLGLEGGFVPLIFELSTRPILPYDAGGFQVEVPKDRQEIVPTVKWWQFWKKEPKPPQVHRVAILGRWIGAVPDFYKPVRRRIFQVPSGHIIAWSKDGDLGGWDLGVGRDHFDQVFWRGRCVTSVESLAQALLADFRRYRKQKAD